jgi:hypothetical protein
MRSADLPAREAHAAWRRRIQDALDDPHEAIREYGVMELLVWAYEDACLRADREAMAHAWAAFGSWQPVQTSTGAARFKMLRLAALFGDFDPAAALVLGYYPDAPLGERRVFDNDEDRDRDYWQRVRTGAIFVLMCAELLLHEPFHGSARAGEVDAAMREVASRNEDVLTVPDQEKLARVGEVRARYHSRMLLARNRAAGTGPLPRAGGSAQRQRATWRAAVDRPGEISARARLAVAWAEWAVGTGTPGYAAEAYQYLVALSARDASQQTDDGERDRVLLAAQEYAEEAGYWLARSGRYREAALALENGRVVELTGSRDVAYGEITAETADGPIVYLAAARATGYALIVVADHDPQYLELPRLDRASVSAMVNSLFGPSGTAYRSARDLAAAVDAPAAPGALRAVWDRGLKMMFGFYARGPIVTLVPVGLFSLLPLQAVGDPGRPGHRETEWHHVGHFSAIRYAPNARALRDCRTVAGMLDGREPTMLAADVPDGPGGHLLHVSRETAEIAGRWDGSTLIHGCTWDEFRAAADRHTVWHLACHGEASRLYFADREVTLDEIRERIPPSPRRLAVLSACRTNVVGAALPNEMVGLPSALLKAGFAGVIATSWPVDDLATTYLMTAFYRYWREVGEAPAVALNRAQQWLRNATKADLAGLLPDLAPPDRLYADPWHWAAFAYTGV